VINHDGTILDAYDKVDLVPFGEYLPAQDFLESLGLRQLTRLAGGFTAGTQRRPLAIPGAPPAIPSICYEIIFPANAAYGAEAVEPAWILNVTNDAWFGVSPGPYQHLHQARLRAIEQGLPVIRAANTGISAVIDPYGRIVGKVNLNVADVIDSTLPRKNAKTLYAQIMNYCQLVIVMSLVLLTMIVNRTLE